MRPPLAHSFTLPRSPVTFMYDTAGAPDGRALTHALDVLDELHRRLGDDGLRALGESHRRRRVGALLAAVRASAARRRESGVAHRPAVAEAIAEMRAGAARSPVLHTLARALERVGRDAGPSVPNAVGRLAGDVPETVLRAIEASVGEFRPPA